MVGRNRIISPSVCFCSSTGVESIGWAHLCSVLLWLVLHLSKGPLRLSDFDFGMYTAIVLGFIYGTLSPCMILIFSIQLRNAAMNKLCGRQPQRPTQSGHTQEHSIMSRFNPTLTTNNNPSTLFSVTESAKRLVTKKETARAADMRGEIRSGH